MGSSEGKIFGVFLGGLLGGPWGALIGGAVGALFDDDSTPQSAPPRLEEQRPPASAQAGPSSHQRRNSSRERQHSGGQRRPQSPLERHLRTLGLRHGVTLAQVKERYRTLAREFHPDTMAGRGLDQASVEQAQEAFKRISEAYHAVQKLLS
jgi:hypothetical protein